MKELLYCLLISLCTTYSLHADNFTGRVLALEDKTPVLYAHVLHAGTAFGILTDENGFFNIDRQLCESIDTLQFSCIGYETLSICMQSLLKDTLVYMKQATIQLNEVFVCGGKFKAKTKKGIGIRIPGGSAVLNNTIDSLNGFSEAGTLFNIKQPFKIEHVLLQVIKAGHSDAYLRLNIYEITNDTIFNIKNTTSNIIKLEKEKNDILYKFPVNIPTPVKGKIYISLELVKFSVTEGKDKFIIPVYMGTSFVKVYSSQKFISYPISLGLKIEGKEFSP